jgi:hypothetical protein
MSFGWVLLEMKYPVRRRSSSNTNNVQRCSGSQIFWTQCRYRDVIEILSLLHVCLRSKQVSYILSLLAYFYNAWPMSRKMPPISVRYQTLISPLNALRWTFHPTSEAVAFRIRRDSKQRNLCCMLWMTELFYAFNQSVWRKLSGGNKKGGTVRTSRN